jgi:hypothetical protein
LGFFFLPWLLSFFFLSLILFFPRRLSFNSSSVLLQIPLLASSSVPFCTPSVPFYPFPFYVRLNIMSIGAIIHGIVVAREPIDYAVKKH